MSMAKVDDIVVLNLEGAEQDVRVVSVHETNGTINVEGVTNRIQHQSVPKEQPGSIRFYRAKAKDEPVMDRPAPIVNDAPVVNDATPAGRAERAKD